VPVYKGQFKSEQDTEMVRQGVLAVPRGLIGPKHSPRFLTRYGLVWDRARPLAQWLSWQTQGGQNNGQAWL
jgi:hypothetical protein